jgi:hypothetical protein
MSNPQDRDSKVIIRAAVVADIPGLIFMMGELASHHADIPGIDAATLERDIFGRFIISGQSSTEMPRQRGAGRAL